LSTSTSRSRTWLKERVDPDSTKLPPNAKTNKQTSKQTTSVHTHTTRNQEQKKKKKKKKEEEGRKKKKKKKKKKEEEGRKKKKKKKFKCVCACDDCSLLLFCSVCHQLLRNQHLSVHVLASASISACTLAGGQRGFCVLDHTLVEASSRHATSDRGE
jgi:cation transport ATPase